MSKSTKPEPNDWIAAVHGYEQKAEKPLQKSWQGRPAEVPGRKNQHYSNMGRMSMPLCNGFLANGDDLGTGGFDDGEEFFLVAGGDPELVE